MTYSVTGITATPDVGFKFGSRHTAEGAKDLATAFIVAGLQEVEVRDATGNLRSLQDLSGTSEGTGSAGYGIADKLSAL